MLASDRPLTTTEIMERVAARVKGLARKDVARIWVALASFVEKQLQRGHAVHLPFFGAFGRSSASTTVAFFSDPVFLHSNRLRDVAHRNGAREVLALSSVQLVYVAQAEELLISCGRDVVQAVIANIVAHVGASAKEGRNINLQMLPLGEWRCYGDVISFQFSSEFQMRLAMMSTRITDQSSATEANHGEGMITENVPSEKNVLTEPGSCGGPNQDESVVSLTSALSYAHTVMSVTSSKSKNTLNLLSGSTSQRTRLHSEDEKLSQLSVSSVSDSIIDKTKRKNNKLASESNRSSTVSLLSKTIKRSSARFSREVSKFARKR